MVANVNLWSKEKNVLLAYQVLYKTRVAVIRSRVKTRPEVQFSIYRGSYVLVGLGNKGTIIKREKKLEKFMKI